MIEIQKTDEFNEWLLGLIDEKSKARIAARIDRLAFGNPGDVAPVGDGVSELRLRFGPGYRVYYKQIGNLAVILLCGGDKASQKKDIAKAKEIAATL